MDLLEVVWNFEPRVVPAWRMPVWYGIMWALGFFIGYKILDRMLKFEKAPAEWMDKILIYVLVGGVLGARFGHILFYDLESYLANPGDILKIWEGGLASHGGAIGVIIAAYLLSKRVTKKPILWILDRLVVPTALAGFLIRMGNLFNHEIVGKVTGSDYGFKFLRHDIPSWEAERLTGTSDLHEAYTMIATDPRFAEVLANIPNRYPAQMYEAFCYLLIFGLLMWLFWRTNASKIKGFLLGAFFIFVFGVRFIIEFFKESQGGTDSEGLVSSLGINMGQILSVPLVLFGLYLVFRKFKEFKRGKLPEQPQAEEKA